MLYSGYLSLYLLQSLNLEVSQTQLVQEPYTAIDDLYEDTLFPENGPVFMQRVHEFRHPIAMASEEKIQRRYGITSAPPTKATVETFKDLLVNNPEYGNPISPIATEIPFIKLYDTSVFVPHIDVNPYTKENTIQTINEPLANEYEEYHTPIETTFQNVDGTRNYKTGVMTKIDEVNAAAKTTNILNEPNDPMLHKTNDDDYPTGPKLSNQGLDEPLMDGPGLNSKAYNEINPILTEKNGERYNEPWRLEPTFTMQNFEVTQSRTTKKNISKKSYNTALMKKIANIFYPDLLTTTQSTIRLGHRIGKGGIFFIKRSHSPYPSTSETTIQRLIGPQKVKPVFVTKSDNAMKETTILSPTLNYVTFMRKKEQLNSNARDTKIQRQKEKNVTKIQRFQETETNKRTLKQKTNIIQRFDGTLKNAPELETKAYKDDPIKINTTDFTQNDDFYSLRTEIASKIFRGTQKYKPSLKKIMNVTKPQTRETIIPKFRKPLRKVPILEAKVSKEYSMSLDTTEFMQNHDHNSIITETASRISRETQKHTPYKKVINVTYPQISKNTIQRFNDPLRYEPDFEPNVDEVRYPVAIETRPVYRQRFDGTIPSIVQEFYRTPSFTSASLMSFINLQPNPSFPSNLASIYPVHQQTAFTVPDLVLSSSAYIRPTATHIPPPESGLVYPWMKTAYHLPGSDLVSTVSYSPDIGLRHLRASTTEVYTELTTERSVMIPSNTLIYDYHEITPEILRAGAPDRTQLRQETYTIIAEPIQDEIIGERLPKLHTRVLTEINKLNRALTERLESEEDSQALTERLESKKETHPTTYVQENEGTEPFSIFLRKLMKVLASKSLRDLQNLIQPFERYVTTLVDSGKLMKLGIVTGPFIGASTPLLHAPIKQIQRYMFIAQISLENRRQMLDDATNEMLTEMDDVFDVSEEEAMQRILNEVTLFPNTSRNEEQIIKDFVDDIFLHPMHRVAGTTKGNVVFEHIAKFANKYMSTYSRRNQKREEDIFKDHFSSGESQVGDPRKNNNYFSTMGSKREGGRKMVIDLHSSDTSKYASNDDKRGVEIRIRINSGKYSKAKSRRKADKIKKTHFRKFYNNDINTRKINSEKIINKYNSVEMSNLEKTKIEGHESSEEDSESNIETLNIDFSSVENLDSKKTKTAELESSKTEYDEENKGKVNRKNIPRNMTEVEVQLDYAPLPFVVSDKKVKNSKNGTEKPLRPYPISMTFDL